MSSGAPGEAPGDGDVEGVGDPLGEPADGEPLGRGPPEGNVGIGAGGAHRHGVFVGATVPGATPPSAVGRSRWVEAVATDAALVRSGAASGVGLGAIEAPWPSRAVGDWRTVACGAVAASATSGNGRGPG